MVNISVADNIVCTHIFSASGRWILHPANDTRLLLLDGQELHIFRWHDLEKEAASGIPINLRRISDNSPVHRRVSWTCANRWQNSKGRLIREVEIPNSRGTGLIYLDISGVQPSTSGITGVYANVDFIKQVVGGYRSKIYFLDKKGWICLMSSKRDALGPEYHTRYFFIPPFWQNEKYCTIRVPNKINVAFAHRDELVIFQNFLEFEHKIPIKQEGSED